jgi:hypothetical protein
MVGPWVQLVGRDHGLQIDGVKLLGFNAINAHKLLLTVVLLGGAELHRDGRRAAGFRCRTE